MPSERVFSSPGELPSARRKETLGSVVEVGHMAFFFILHPLAANNGRALHHDARHEEADDWEGGRYAPGPPGFGPGITKPKNT